MLITQKGYYQSPIGLIEIATKGTEIISVKFVEKVNTSKSVTDPIILKCIAQLDEYFNHQRKEFSFSLNPKGTDFQKRVWSQLFKIPYGQTASYQEIARRLGNEKAIRAVGQANGSNPIAIIVPCHRVIGANGKLVGYGGGLWRKKWLLQHENALLV